MTVRAVYDSFQRGQLVHPSGELAALPRPLPVSPNQLI